MARTRKSRLQNLKEQWQSQPEPDPEPRTPRSQMRRGLKGLFSDGQWWCNCEPRKKMNLLETKKEGPTKGKLFYKCFDCELFIWWDQARVRETGLASSSSSSRPVDQDVGDTAATVATPKTPSLTQKQLTAYGYERTTPSSTSRRSHLRDESDSGSDTKGAPDDDQVSGFAAAAAAAAAAVSGLETPSASAAASKRKRDVFEDESDGFSDFSSGEERELIEIADKSAEKLKAQPPPPVVAGPAGGGGGGGSGNTAFTTPTHPRSSSAMVGGLPTPSVSRTLFPSAKRQKHVSFEDLPGTAATTATAGSSTASPATLGRSTPGTSSSSTTTPSRSVSSSASGTTSTISTTATTPDRPPLPPSSSPPDDGRGCDVTEQVMSLLSKQTVDAATLRSVRAVLEVAARRAKGLALGRESAKAAVRARDEAVARLQERVVALENRDATHRRQITNFKANLMKMYEDN